MCQTSKLPSSVLLIGVVVGGFQFAIDRGGTFTDVWALCPDGRQRVLKLLSEDPRNYDDAPREGIRRILEQVKYPAFLAQSNLAWIRAPRSYNAIDKRTVQFLLCCAIPNSYLKPDQPLRPR